MRSLLDASPRACTCAHPRAIASYTCAIAPYALVLALFLLASLTAAPLTATAQGTGGSAPAAMKDDILQQVEARYASIDGLQATFTRTVDSGMGAAQEISGTLYLAGPRYRVETRSQTFVTDGATTWIYTPSQKQVIVNAATDDGASLTPETFFTDYAARYTVEARRDITDGGTSYVELDLSPSAPTASFDDVVLWVRPDTYVIDRLSVQDANGNRITIRLNEVQINPDLSNSLFTFDTPGGVEVVDLRSE
jgi:outer membrane lipoprotein carrier protein